VGWSRVRFGASNSNVAWLSFFSLSRKRRAVEGQWKGFLHGASRVGSLEISGIVAGDGPGGARKFMRGVAAFHRAAAGLGSEYRLVDERHAGCVRAKTGRYCPAFTLKNTETS